MLELEEFLNNLNKIDHLNNDVSQLVYVEKLNDFILKNDSSWLFLINLFRKKIKVSDFNNYFRQN
jgi:hypothetical protein